MCPHCGDLTSVSPGSVRKRGAYCGDVVLRTFRLMELTVKEMRDEFRFT